MKGTNLMVEVHFSIKLVKAVKFDLGQKNDMQFRRDILFLIFSSHIILCLQLCEIVCLVQVQIAFTSYFRSSSDNWKKTLEPTSTNWSVCIEALIPCSCCDLYFSKNKSKGQQEHCRCTIRRKELT